MFTILITSKSRNFTATEAFSTVLKRNNIPRKRELVICSLPTVYIFNRDIKNLALVLPKEYTSTRSQDLTNNAYLHHIQLEFVIELLTPPPQKDRCD